MTYELKDLRSAYPLISDEENYVKKEKFPLSILSSKTFYMTAVHHFLHRELGLALNYIEKCTLACEDIGSLFHTQVWCFYITVIDSILTLPSTYGKRVINHEPDLENLRKSVNTGDVWDHIIQRGYTGQAKQVNLHVVINLAVLTLKHATCQRENQRRIHPYIIMTRDSLHPTELPLTITLFEVYTLEVLPRIGQINHARQLIKLCGLLRDDNHRSELLSTLERLTSSTDPVSIQPSQSLSHSKSVSKSFRKSKRLHYPKSSYLPNLPSTPSSKSTSVSLGKFRTLTSHHLFAILSYRRAAIALILTLCLFHHQVRSTFHRALLRLIFTLRSSLAMATSLK